MSPSRLDYQTMMLHSPFGVDGMKFRPKEFYGWAIPVVMNNTYNFFVNSTFEWTSGSFRLSEPSWVTPSEWVLLSTNFSSYRYQVRCGCLLPCRCLAALPWCCLAAALPLPCRCIGAALPCCCLILSP
jgi:hypothetical protein